MTAAGRDVESINEEAVAAGAIEPYYRDEWVTLYHGRHEDVLPTLGLTFDLIVADPPYGETSLDWDRWPTGWPALMQDYARSMWCFGSLRMYLTQASEFTGWKLSQDLIWEKHNGSGFAADRFKRVHEQATHWYLGPWGDIHHETPRIPGGAGNKSVRKRGLTPHTGAIGNVGYEDDGLRLVRSVIYAPSMQQRAINETEKPTGVLEPMIGYGCPPGGLVLDPFGGSASTAVAARASGRRCVVVEAREQQCEAATKRLQQGTLDFGASA